MDCRDCSQLRLADHGELLLNAHACINAERLFCLPPQNCLYLSVGALSCEQSTGQRDSKAVPGVHLGRCCWEKRGQQIEERRSHPTASERGAVIIHKDCSSQGVFFLEHVQQVPGHGFFELHSCQLGETGGSKAEDPTPCRTGQLCCGAE